MSDSTASASEGSDEPAAGAARAIERLIRRRLAGDAGEDVETAAYEHGQELFAAEVPLGDVLAAHRDAALAVASAAPGRAAEVTDAVTATLQQLMASYDVRLRQERDYHGAQRQLNDVLRHQVEGLNATVDELERERRTADDATREKALLLANMSHEIRTPLNAVVGLASLLGDARPEERAEYVRTILGSADHLLLLIDDVLDFSKIEAGTIELERAPLHLGRCVELALEMVAGRAAEKALELAYVVGPGVPPGVVGDEVRLRQVLLNLLSNAVKFSDRGEVVVEVDLLQDGAGDPQLRFAVRDQGIGIARDRLARVFEPFTQADPSTTRRYGGTGLGLAISSRLVGLMGGTLTVDSEVGVGSRFSFAIPVEPVDLPLPSPSTFAPDALAGLRVLVVDDLETNRRILDAHARAWGMSCAATADPAQALAWLRDGERFALAILDHHMPGVDGVSLARRLRAEPRGASLPLMLLSSATRKGRQVDPAGELFAAVLAKPIKQSTLRDEVAVALGLPREPDPGRQRAAEAVSELRILVAEDSVVNQMVVRRLLRRLGCERVDVVGDGLQAVTAAAGSTYDAILMDVQMPIMDGSEATRQIIDAADGGRRPRLIALTAEALPGDRERYLGDGFDDYLAKPVTVDMVAAALARCLPDRADAARSPVVRRRAVDGPDRLEQAAALRGHADALRAAIDFGHHEQARSEAVAVAAYLTDAGLSAVESLQALLEADPRQLERRGLPLVSRVQKQLRMLAFELERATPVEPRATG